MKRKCNNQGEVSLCYDGWACAAVVNFIVLSGTAAALVLIFDCGVTIKGINVNMKPGGWSVFYCKRFGHLKRLRHGGILTPAQLQ